MGNQLKERAMAPAQRQGKPAGLPDKIRGMEQQFALAMPKGMEATQLVRDALTCLRQTPQLAECAPDTVLGALMTCSQLGLRPGVLGQAYLLPLWNGKNRRREAQLIIGYQGLTELIWRSGEVQMIDARVVYSNDEFMFEYGLAEDKLVHRPPMTGERGEPVAFYAIARMKNGGYAMTDVMTMADMQRHRDKYAMAKKKDGTVVGPWVSEFVEMARKTMIRRLAKQLPKSPEVQRAITHDGAVRVDYSPAGVDQEPHYIDGTVEDVPGTPAAVDSPPTGQPAPEPTPSQDEPPVEMMPADAVKVPSEAMVRKLHALLGNEGVKDRGERLTYLSEQVKRTISSSKDLTYEECADLINFLEQAQEGGRQ